MRYAPTPVRLNFGLCWGMGELRFRSHQGVCDTPPTLVRLKSGLCWGMGGLRFRPHQGVCDTPPYSFPAENGSRVGFISMDLFFSFTTPASL